MPRKPTTLCLAALLLFALARAPRTARGQTSLFTVPTGEVMPEGESYLEFDFDTRPLGRRDGGFQSYGVFLVRGVGKNVEVGANVYFLKDGDGESEPVEFQSDVVWRFYNDEGKGLQAAVGGILFAPAGRRGRGDTVGMLYASATKTVEGAYGPRLTGGGYGLVGRANGNGSEGGAIVGYEQPVHKRLSFVADWLSGKNRFGYLTPGFSVALPRSSALYAGYSVGNFGRKNNALFVYYGITF